VTKNKIETELPKKTNLTARAQEHEAGTDSAANRAREKQITGALSTPGSENQGKATKLAAAPATEAHRRS
jgi:hypothetical protein